LFVSQLARKHPVPFFQFLDICARSGQLHLNMFDEPHMAQLLVNGSSRIGTKGLAEPLSSPAATAALGSAMCSIMKLVTAGITAQAAAPPAAQAAGPDEGAVSSIAKVALFSPLQVLPLLQQLSSALKAAVRHALQAPDTAIAAMPSAAAGSSSRGEQVRASAVFLWVLLHQRLLALHEAAAGFPGATASGLVSTAAAASTAIADATAVVCDDNDMQELMLGVSDVLSDTAFLAECLQQEDTTAAQGYISGTSQPSTSLSPAAETDAQGSSSSSNQAVRWQYLLRLHESRKLAAAMAAVRTKWSPAAVQAAFGAGAAAQAAGGAPAAAQQAGAAVSRREQFSKQIRQLQPLYDDLLGFCRTLAAVAPLPVVCNNAGCVALHDVSEAAAARFVCSGCRYCSAACQAAGWRSHNKACRRMAVCGMRVEGR
jgi:hypothetical protein